ncbi:MAG: hypothetical protein JXR68_11285 [Bacteroidales bacterium]|nr:hypothetical protein [Bacteroidales bacterium]
MRKIKIKLPFEKETVNERHSTLIEMAQILSNDLYFTIIEEKHYESMSYMVVYVADNLEIHAQVM